MLGRNASIAEGSATEASGLRRAGSWADRLTARLDRAPLPTVAIYGAAFVAIYAVLVVLEWASGSSLSDAFRVFQPVAAGVLVGFPWLIGAFNRSASRAIRRASPLVPGGAEQLMELEARLIEAPSRLSVGLGLIVFLGILSRIALNPAITESLQLPTEPPAVWVAIGLVTPMVGMVAAAYLVKVVHLAWGVHRVTTRELRVDIWELAPLLSFATLTARMAASILVVMLGVVLVSPRVYSGTLGAVAALGAIALAAGVFALPLLGLHGRLLAARGQAETGLARQMERAIARLGRADAADDLAAMDPINKEIGALEAGMRTVRQIQTWPWEPELFRWIVGALLFPVALIVIQYVLARLLQP